MHKTKNLLEAESVYLVQQFLFSFSVVTLDWPLLFAISLSLAIQSRSDSNNNNKKNNYKNNDNNVRNSFFSSELNLLQISCWTCP